MVLSFAIALALTGVIAGIYHGTALNDARIRDLDARAYVAMHQMRDATFRKVMPVLMLITLLSVIVICVLSWPDLRRVALTGFAALLILIDLVFTITRQVPRNRLICSWKLDAIPDNWRDVRDAWDAHHRLRVPIASAAFVCVIVAAIS